jgi:hypothetical protein
VVSKYADHSPLYRQSAILLRDAGVDISRGTMCGWVMTVGEMLVPVVGAMRKELLASSYIQADETPWMCRRMISVAKIIRRTYGSMGHRAGRRSSIFA